MAESLFDIFGDHILKQTNRVIRQPLANAENVNIAKKTAGPTKPQDPTKPTKEIKKSFMNNVGTKLLPESATPRRTALASRPLNVPSAAATAVTPPTQFISEDMEFTKPQYRYDNYHRDVLDYLPVWEPAPPPESPARNPVAPHTIHSMEFDDSFCDAEFFSNNLSNNSIDADDLGLPDLY